MASSEGPAVVHGIDQVSSSGADRPLTVRSGCAPADSDGSFEVADLRCGGLGCTFAIAFAACRVGSQAESQAASVARSEAGLGAGSLTRSCASPTWISTATSAAFASVVLKAVQPNTSRLSLRIGIGAE